jgi:hypothetical protein
MLQNVTKPVCAADTSPDNSPFAELLKAIEQEVGYQLLLRGDESRWPRHWF